MTSARFPTAPRPLNAARRRRVSVNEIITFYQDHLGYKVSSGQLERETLIDTQQSLGTFAETHGTRAVSRMRQADLLTWLDRYSIEWRSDHTRKRRLAGVLRCFNWAAENELIDRCPFKKPSGYRIQVKPRRAALVSEYVKLMRSAPRHIRRTIFFMRRTGARTCEMRQLRWREVDLRRGLIVLREHKTAKTTAVAKDRTIALEPCVLRFLRNLHRTRPRGNEDHVFLNGVGTPWRDRWTYGHAFRRACDRAALPRDLVAYCIRHLYCTLAIKAGLPDRQIADLMGHSSTELVGWYAHAADDKNYLRSCAAKAVRRPMDHE